MQVLSDPKNILVVRLDHIGDVLMATPVPKALKENFSGVRITLLTSTQGAQLFLNNPFVDEVLAYDAPWFAARRYKRVAGRSLGSLAKELRRKKFDVGLSLRGDVRENWLLWASGIPSRVGYGITGGGFFLTQEVCFREGVHQVNANLDILHRLGARPLEMNPALYFSTDERRAFDEKWRAWGLSETAVAYQPAAGTTAKNWPQAESDRFIEAFAVRFPGRALVLVGAAAVVETGGLRNVVVDLRGKTTLREAALLAEKAAAFVGPDSGPTHLAAAMGTPTLFLYSGTNEFERWRPLPDNAHVLRRSVPCAPCGLSSCNVSGHPCMSLIICDDVLNKLAELIR